MWCNNQANAGKVEASTSTDTLPKTESIQNEHREQTVPTAIAIIEPRKKFAGVGGANCNTTTTTSTTTRQPLPEWSILPHDVDVNNDIVRLVSSLSNVIQILIRMSNTAAHELLLHPEREEDFEGLRTLLNYADQMYSTLLQPQSNLAEQPSGSPTNRNESIPSGSLFHHLFEPMLSPYEIRQEGANRTLTRTLPTRIVAGIVEVAETVSNPIEPTYDSSTNTDTGEIEPRSVP